MIGKFLNVIEEKELYITELSRIVEDRKLCVNYTRKPKLLLIENCIKQTKEGKMYYQCC